jgi:type VI secretion system protein ImpH
MPTPQRLYRPSIIQRLLNEPYRFEPAQAMRVLDLWFRRNGLAGDAGWLRYVRFHNSLSMSFPASQIESLTAMGEQRIRSDQALQAALQAAQLKRFTLTPAFMGFFGVNGVMPNFYTADIADQIRDTKFEGNRAFFDIFYNRIMVLHLLASDKHRVLHHVDERGDAAILPMQLALAGARRQRPVEKRGSSQGEKADAPDAGMRHEDSERVPDEVIARYAALLRNRPVSACLIEGVLAEYFELPITLEQFVAQRDDLHENELWKLGQQNTAFGQGMILGSRIWERHARVRLHIGPLSIADYNRFLPGESGFKALKSMLALFATKPVEFELRLILRASDIKPVCLNALPGNRLGFDSHLITTPALQDRGDYLFELGM